MGRGCAIRAETRKAIRQNRTNLLEIKTSQNSSFKSKSKQEKNMKAGERNHMLKINGKRYIRNQFSNLFQIIEHVWSWFMKIWTSKINHLMWILNIIYSWVNRISTPYWKNNKGKSRQKEYKARNQKTYYGIKFENIKIRIYVWCNLLLEKISY